MSDLAPRCVSTTATGRLVAVGDLGYKLLAGPAALSGSAEQLLGLVDGVGDHSGGYFAEFDVAGLGSADQKSEGAVGVESVAFHQDADRLPDRAMAGQCLDQRLLVAGLAQCKRDQAGEQRAQLPCFDVELVCFVCVEVQGAAGVRLGGELECDLGADSECRGGLPAVLRPAKIRSHIIDLNDRFAQDCLKAGTLLKVGLKLIGADCDGVGRREGLDGRLCW